MSFQPKEEREPRQRLCVLFCWRVYQGGSGRGELWRSYLRMSSCPVQWGNIEEAWAWPRHTYGQEANWWMWVRGTEGQETNLEAAAVSKKEILLAFTFCFRLMRAFPGRWWNPFSMTFKRMATELDIDKLAAAARVPRYPWCPWALLQVCRQEGPAQLCSVLSKTLWTVKEKHWKWRSLSSYYARTLY